MTGTARRLVAVGNAKAAAVLVPVKAFADAKLRLAPALSPSERAALAQSMAERLIAAATPIPVAVTCEDRGVAAWAEGLGARVVWTPGTGLNGAVQMGFRELVDDGYDLVIVAHADLPHAQRLERVVDFDSITIVPDRRDDGTNVLALPANVPDFRFSYGPASFARHLDEASRTGGRVRVLRLPDLQWDVDTPDDLPLPAST